MGVPDPPTVGQTALVPGTFDGDVVMVTGGGTGLGKAIACEFARLGAAVAIVSRDPQHRAAGILAVVEAGGRAHAVAADVRDAGAVAQAFDEVEAELGAVDHLVNNAAGNFPSPAEDLSPNAFGTVVDIVLKGTFNCSREFGRRHLAAGTPGTIINIGATYSWTGGPGFAHSAAAKAGVKHLTETLAVEWGPYGIRVNGLVPGMFPHADEAAHIVDGVPERRTQLAHRQPVGRVGRPHELGWAATFLASPFAGMISGATLVCDGANWQRRAMLMPEVVPIREQMGKGPFTLHPEVRP